MDTRDLNIPVGTPMQVELLAGKGNARFNVSLIGFVAGKTMMVTMPPAHECKVKLYDGDELAVRFLQGNAVHGLKTHIQRVCTDPIPYLHLVFPSSIESAKIRSTYRVNTSYTISVQCDGANKKNAARLVDLSEDGAKIISVDDLGKTGEKIQLEGTFSFGGVQEKLILSATIRNANNEEGGQHSYGIEFVDVKQQDMMFLRGVIYEQMVNERAGN